MLIRRLSIIQCNGRSANSVALAIIGSCSSIVCFAYHIANPRSYCKALHHKYSPLARIVDISLMQLLTCFSPWWNVLKGFSFQRFPKYLSPATFSLIFMLQLYINDFMNIITSAISNLYLLFIPQLSFGIILLH